MDALQAQIQALAAATDDVGRKKLVVALRDAAFALETPDDTMQRIYGLVSFFLLVSPPFFLLLYLLEERGWGRGGGGGFEIGKL